jgi:hypothetical protein
MPQIRLPEEIANIALNTTVQRNKIFLLSGKKIYRRRAQHKAVPLCGLNLTQNSGNNNDSDAAEASIRMLTDRSKKVIEAQVKEIIDERMDLEQFSECDITMKDIYTIIEQIVKISAGIYHERTLSQA